MTDIKSGIGIHSLWGYGPSQNLMEFCSGCLPKSNVDAINILLVQPCDPRHIIHTISRQCDKRSKGQQRPIRFYIIEPQIEILARSILLLNIFFRKEIPIRHRAALFLEVYGNTLIQEKTESILHEMGTNLTNMVYGDKFDGHLGNILDLSALKQRDRDALVDTFKSWRTDVMFDITSLRDHRLRGYYQDRYDW
jgi:dynein assembly factor 3